MRALFHVQQGLNMFARDFALDGAQQLYMYDCVLESFVEIWVY